MMGTKIIYDRMFSKHFIYTIYETFNDKCYKKVTNDHINVLIIIMGSEVKFNIILRLFIYETIILCLKLLDSGLKIVPPYSMYFKNLPLNI